MGQIARTEFGEGIEATREYHHRPTQPLDELGQGDAPAHRAVVAVDVELGLVRVVEIASAQDVGGRALTRVPDELFGL